MVPLENGGFAPGLVARHAPRSGAILGYFFGPRLSSIDNFSFDCIIHENSVYCKIFGDIGLIENRWPIIGQLPEWNRNEWTMPIFIKRKYYPNNRSVLVYYDENNPDNWIRDEIIEGDRDLPEAGTAGYQFIEIKLSKILARDK